jgi:hypothetical protein
MSPKFGQIRARFKCDFLNVSGYVYVAAYAPLTPCLRFRLRVRLRRLFKMHRRAPGQSLSMQFTYLATIAA